MTGMSAHIGWDEVALRLALAVAAGLLIGYNRTEHGKAAGLRTTLLVCLAACIAMIQVNLLLPTGGRSSDSFVMNDLMRLPLGILTGVGFIGAGAIIRRDNIVVGVTTAATLWYVTVVGLCLGGGQIWLGVIATALGLAALWVVQWFELQLRQQLRARLHIEWEGGSLSEDTIRRMLQQAGLQIAGSRLSLSVSGKHRAITLDLIDYCLPHESKSPDICETLAGEAGVVKLEWRRQ